jgi:hypothetical protein
MSDIDELNEFLWDAEEIGAYVNSSCKEFSGILVATNRRIFFLSKGESSMKITNLIYINKIKSVEYGIGPYSGWIEIGIKKTRKHLRFDNIDNNSVIEISEYIKNRVENFDKWSDYVKSEIDN